MVKFIADLHFHHESMAIKRGFKDANEQNEYIIKQWNKVTHKKDVIYILGDITMEKANYDILDKLNGIKKVVLGNHDKPQHVPKLLLHVNSVAGMIKYKDKRFGKMFLTHCPIRSNELAYRVKYNIHGHIHENIIKTWYGTKDKRYICVSCEHVNYQPKSLKQLIKTP